MRNYITIMAWAIGFAGLAQSTITYPYNPDGNADTLIGVTDLQDLLTTYGQPFLPSEILVEGQTLTTVINELQQSIDSLLIAMNSESSELRLECVSMGISPLCGGLGLDPASSLEPLDDGYTYQIEPFETLNGGFFIQHPHWRKFQLKGMSAENLESLTFRYQARTQTVYGQGIWNDVIATIQPQTDSNGDVFFYLYTDCNSSGCECATEEGIGLAIPLEHSFRVGFSSSNTWRQNLEIWYSDGNSLISTGLMLNVQSLDK